MIGVHEFKITVQSVSGSAIMDVVYRFRDDRAEHFRDSSWIGEVEPGKFADAVCEVIKATCSSPVRASVPLHEAKDGCGCFNNPVASKGSGN